MAFELQQLRQVIALAEHGSFVRAAAVLHISQPALSRSIQNLEKHLGSNLFVRSSGGAVPTDLGRLYIERARDLLRMADDLDREVVTQGNLRTGRVAVGGGPFTTESFLGLAAVRFTEQYPRVSVHLTARDWDELLRGLRSRELDFFVAESSTLQKEPDLEIVPLPGAHSLHFVARSGHPLMTHDKVGAADVFAWPFAAPGRIPPRLLDPMLAAHRDATRRGLEPRPFPSIQCVGLGPVKRILAASDAISASILSCIATELETGQFVLLGTEPWLRLHYGIVSLRGRPSTHAAEKFRQFVVEAEQAATAEEKRLLARFGKSLIGPQEPPARPKARKRPGR
jgi:DNA-binding transcriptional LysR family regulator